MKKFKKIKIFKVFILIAFFSLLNSCDKEEIPVSRINEAELTIIEQLGFNTENIQDLGDAFLVEGDILLRKESLGSYYPSKQDGVKLKQARVGMLIFTPNQRNITVRVDNSIPTSGVDNWRPEVEQAIEHWNSLFLECNLSFAYTSNSSADITIQSDQGDLNDGNYRGWTLAEAEWPLDGKPGSRIRINLDTDDNRTMTSGQKVYNIVHEIGHCVGLRHTNWYGRESEGIGVPGTPNEGFDPDPNSVMNAGTALNSWDKFSHYDSIAIRNMYPYIPSSHSSSITADGPKYMSASTTLITWTCRGGGSDNIEWWYRKIGGPSSILIGRGSSVTLGSLPGSFYSNQNYKTSNFVIYVKVYGSNGSLIGKSPEYEIIKKGKFDLVNPRM